MRPALVRESDGPPDLESDTFRMISHDRHPMGQRVDLAAPNAVRPRRAAIAIPGPASKYGDDTRRVLARIGFDEAEIDGMIASGAAAEEWSDQYLPE
ncbi:MAG: hypothetical protein ACE5GC_07545 [Acidimicrobiia bacterium]